MGLTWQGFQITEDLWHQIYLLTGVLPKQTSLVYASSAVTGISSYATNLDISSGPYMLVAVRANPTNYASGYIDIRVTIDGSLTLTKTQVPPTGDNFVVGLFFDDMTRKDDVAPLLARSSIKIETKSIYSTPKAVEYIYAGYSLS
jgi:hypothetical protein